MSKHLDQKVVYQASRILKTIAHPIRLKIIEALSKREKSVKELMMLLHQNQITISKHLKLLRHHKILKSRTEGQFRFYSIAYPNVLYILDCVRRHGQKGT